MTLKQEKIEDMFMRLGREEDEKQEQIEYVRKKAFKESKSLPLTLPLSQLNKMTMLGK